MRLLKHLLNSAFKLIPLILITFLYTLYYRILRLRTKKLYRELVASTSKKKASYAKFVSVLKRLPRIALSITGWTSAALYRSTIDDNTLRKGGICR
jgi:hypothetical protein